VIHACKELSRRGKRVAILSRGYRGGPGGNDEKKVIARHLDQVAHLEDPDRFAAGSRIAAETDVFVLDDGFQHLPLFRDHDVVLVDATDPFGGGFCPPAGRLREPLSALDRATLVVITRADLVDRASLGETMRRIRERTAAPVVTTAFRARCDEPLDGLQVTVACGIGNPRAFVLMVERLGATIAERRFFRDHHAYTRADADALVAHGRPVVVTEKDAVKLEALWPPGPPLITVGIELAILDGAAHLDSLFDRL
jgi:tetraacyldisaccharide 4'-kinase